MIAVRLITYILLEANIQQLKATVNLCISIEKKMSSFLLRRFGTLGKQINELNESVVPKPNLGYCLCLASTSNSILINICFN